MKVYDPDTNSWKLTSTIHDAEAKVIIGYIFHFSLYAYGFSSPMWPAFDPTNLPAQPLRFPVNEARPKNLWDTHDLGDLIVMDYPWAQAPNGCSVVGSGVPKIFPDFTAVCNQHDRCYYTFRSNQPWDKAELTREAWTNCNQNLTADLLKTCNPFYTRKQIKIKTIKDFFGAVVEVFKTVLVKTALSESCVIAAGTIATAVDTSAVLTDGFLPCKEGGCYTKAQKKQLSYQTWLEKVVRQPHCTVTGSADQLTLTIDSWDQPDGSDIDPYFMIADGLTTPGVTFEQISYNQWKGQIDRLGEFKFRARSKINVLENGSISSNKLKS